jgi:hypothetical protein
MTQEKPSRFRESFRVKLLIGLSAVIIMVLLFPKGESLEFEVTEGTIWIHEDLIAPFSFAILKDPNIYRSELNTASQSVYPIYVNDQQIVSQILDSLRNYSDYLISIIDEREAGDISENPTFLSSDSFQKLKEMRISERGLLQLRELRLAFLFESLEATLTNIYAQGILDSKNGLAIEDSIAVRTGNVDRIESVSMFNSLDEAKELLKTRLNKKNLPADIKSVLNEYAQHFILSNIIFN